MDREVGLKLDCELLSPITRDRLRIAKGESRSQVDCDKAIAAKYWLGGIKLSRMLMEREPITSFAGSW